MLHLTQSSTDAELALRRSPQQLLTQQTVLSVSWLDGSIRAMAVHKGIAVGTYECHRVVTDAAEFGSVLREAVVQTGYEGSNVSIVLAHRHLGQQLLSVPTAARGGLMQFIERQAQFVLYLGVPPGLHPAIRRYVQRQVANLKSFDGPAVWCFEYTAPIEGANGLLVHLFPKQIIDKLIHECTAAGLRLVSVVPVTAAVHFQFQHLQLGQDEVAMLIADTGQSTAIVVGRADGQLYLSRFVSGGWTTSVRDLIVDLQRTVLFVKEEYGVNVSSIWLFGPEAHKYVSQVQSEVGISTAESSVSWNQFYWSRALAELVPKTTPNFISREQILAPHENLWLKFITIAGAVIVVACIGTTVYLGRLISNEQAALKAIKARIAEAEKQRLELQKLNAELEAKRETIRLVAERRLPPVPGWFLAYLGEAVPEDLLLTGLKITREGELWRVKVTGVSQPSTNAQSSTIFSKAVQQFKARLEKGPFHVALVPENAGDGSRQSNGSWLKRFAAPTVVRNYENRQFTVEGIIR